MSEVGAFKPPNKIGEMLVSSRSLAEYRKMFLLTDQDTEFFRYSASDLELTSISPILFGGLNAPTSLMCSPCQAVVPATDLTTAVAHRSAPATPAACDAHNR